MNYINFFLTFKLDTISISIIGILLILIGTYFIYKFSSKNTHIIDGGNASTDFKAIEIKAKRNNNLMKLGFALIFIGTLIQIIILFK